MTDIDHAVLASPTEHVDDSQTEVRELSVRIAPEGASQTLGVFLHLLCQTRQVNQASVQYYLVKRPQERERQPENLHLGPETPRRLVLLPDFEVLHNPSGELCKDVMTAQVDQQKHAMQIGALVLDACGDLGERDGGPVARRQSIS